MAVRPAKEFEQWLSRHIAGCSPGDRLPTGKRLAAAWSLSEGTVRSILRRFRDEGKLLLIQGKGTFVPGDGSEPDPAETADPNAVQTIVDFILEAIARGDLKLGRPLPSVKYMRLQFHVAPMTVIRAYRALKERGDVVRVGKRYWVGNFRTLIGAGSHNEIRLFSNADDIEQLFSHSVLSNAYREMEYELLSRGFRLRYEPIARFGSACAAWKANRDFPFGIIIAGNDPAIHEKLRRQLESMVRGPRGSGSSLLMAGKRVDRRIRGIHYLCQGHIDTARSRLVARYCFDKHFSAIRLFFDAHHTPVTMLRSLIRVFPEVRHLDKQMKMYLHIKKHPNFPTFDSILAHIRRSLTLDEHYLEGIMNKYNSFSLDELSGDTSIVGNFAEVFQSSGGKELWLFGDDDHAARCLAWCREHHRDVPGETAIAGVANSPRFYHLGISSFVADWRTIGYLMAHALIGDIPIERSSKGYVRTRVAMFSRLTTP